MRPVVTVAYWESIVLLAGSLGILFRKLVTGEIPLGGLLDGDVRDPTSAGRFSCQASAGRAQSLTVTLFVALWYLLQQIS